MEPTRKTIEVKTVIDQTVEKVWQYWTATEAVMKWNHASEDWHTTRAENDLQEGGKFNYRMEAKDGSFGFNFWGIYDKVRTNEMIEYTLGDNRKVKIIFISSENRTEIIETFDAENENPVAMQHDGWQSILNNFKKYAESNN